MAKVCGISLLSGTPKMCDGEGQGCSLWNKADQECIIYSVLQETYVLKRTFNHMPLGKIIKRILKKFGIESIDV